MKTSRAGYQLGQFITFLIMLMGVARDLKSETLLNVDLAAFGRVKVGLAATGQGSGDFWNDYTAPYIGFAGLSNLKMANGAVSTVGMTVQNGAGQTIVPHDDPMYQVALYATDFGDITVTVTNLPGGEYDFYVYGHAGANSANSVLQLLVGGNDRGNKATATDASWSLTNWVEGAQYVVFRGVQVTNGGAPVVIKSHPGASGYTYLNGLQIVFRSTETSPPAIVSQPSSQSVFVGESATFSVTASSSLLISYQWRFGGTNLPGATNLSLTLTNVQINAAGNYSVVVSNALGAAISSNAVLTINPPPTVTLLNVDLAAFGRVKVGLAATGQGGADFWNDYTAPYIGFAGLSNLKMANGAVSTVGMTVQNGAGQTIVPHDDPMYQVALYATDFGDITVTVTNLPGGEYDFYVYGHAGDSTANSVMQLLVGGNDRGNKATATDASWSLTNWVEGAQYVVFRGVQVTNGGAPVVIKSHPGISGYTYLNGLQISLAASTPPSITAQPQSHTVTVGQNVTFSVTATGSDPLVYQWRRSGTNLVGSTSSTLTLTNVQMTQAGNYSVAVSNNYGAIVSSNAVLTVNFPPAVLRVVDTPAAGGNFVTVPVQFVANGNENALGFSLNFDPSVLTFSQASLGSGISGAFFFPNISQVASGKVGFAIALSAGNAFAPGTQTLVNVTFAVAPVTNSQNTICLFADQPTTRQISDAQAIALAANYYSGNIAISATEFEADASPRPGGDKLLTITDWVQVGRFAAKLDMANAGSEFQHADCAPRGARGNGAITVTDWVQAGRYVAGLDPLTAAGGPTSSGSSLLMGNLRQSGNTTYSEEVSTRSVRVIGATALAGGVCSIAVKLEGQGDENALGFSLNFDPAKASFASASLGSGAAGAIFNVNTNFASAGRIGIVLALPTGGSFSVSNREIVKVNFAVSLAATGGIAVSFTNQPVSSEISSPSADELAANYINAALTVSPFPPAIIINKLGSNLVLSWPTAATDFLLQTNASLYFGSWGVLPISPITNGGNNNVTLPMSEARMFYRLVRP